MIAYRYLTDSDFFNIYKPAGTETGGGGQTYIDFPTGSISATEWDSFFAGVLGLKKSTTNAGRPHWSVPVHSIGVADPAPLQTLSMYQRRDQTVSVGGQSINTRAGDRVNGWDSSEGFPEPADPTARQGQRPIGLVVYLARTDDREVWAGWFQLNAASPLPPRDSGSKSLLAPMIDAANLGTDGSAGMIDLRKKGLVFEETVRDSPFYVTAAAPAQTPAVPRQKATPMSGTRYERTDEEILGGLFADDGSVDESKGTAEQKAYYTQVRRRNTKAASSLKQLYGYECQLTGSAQVFSKRDGTGYVEAHHLVPLGAGGADDPRNIIVVSAMVHRMLHYAAVDPNPIDLSRIVLDKDGWGVLSIRLDGDDYTIRWHPGHAAAVVQAAAD